jgi:transposase
MAMGRRKDRAHTPGLWIATNELPRTSGHPFYQRLNQILDAHDFDAFVEVQCAVFYADTVGRPSLPPWHVLPAAASAFDSIRYEREAKLKRICYP